MPALAARVRSWRRATVGAAATAAGRVGRTAPGIAGPLLICFGLHQAWAPLGFIAAGAFLLMVDRAIP